MHSTKIQFGGVEYDVPRLNVGQIEELSEIENTAPLKRSLGTIRVALKRAVPKMPDEFTDIETTAEEIGVAYAKILIAAGVAKAADDPNGVAPDHKPGKVKKAEKAGS